MEGLATRVRLQSKRINSHARALLMRTPGEWIGYLRDRVGKCRQCRRVYQHYETSHEAPTNYGATVMAFAPEIFKRQVDVHRIIGRAYRLQPYAGDFTLFSVRRFDHAIFQRRWERLARGTVTFFALPGNHLTLLEAPYVGVLADKLSGLLDQSP